MTSGAGTLARRRFLVGAAGVALLPSAPARATTAEVVAAIAALTGGATPRPGKVKLDMPALVENGNAVGMTVSVDAPLRGQGRVAALHVFAEGNPLPRVLSLRLGPRAGLPRIATRIRLATSQTVVAVAELADGTYWSDSAELVVTLAACVE